MSLKNSIHSLPDILDPGNSRALLETHILTGCDFNWLDSNYHPSTQNHKSFFTTEEGSEDDYVSQEAEKYHMKFSESNLSAESFDHLRYMICTNRKIKLVDLPPTFSAIQKHLLQAYYFTNISLKFLDTIKSTLQPLIF